MNEYEIFEVWYEMWYENVAKYSIYRTYSSS